MTELFTDKSWSKCLYAGKECNMSERGCDGMFAEGIDCTSFRSEKCHECYYGRLEWCELCLNCRYFGPRTEDHFYSLEEAREAWLDDTYERGDEGAREREHEM